MFFMISFGSFGAPDTTGSGGGDADTFYQIEMEKD
jgi:hypothetical protein